VVYVDGAPLDGAPAGAPRAGAAPAGAPPAAHRLPESSDWIASAVRHWNVDRPDPR